MTHHRFTSNCPMYPTLHEVPTHDCKSCTPCTLMRDIPRTVHYQQQNKKKKKRLFYIKPDILLNQDLKEYHISKCEQFLTATFVDVPVDVEDSNERVLLHISDQSLIDMLYNPVEELGVDVFGEGIASVGGLKARKRLDVSLVGRFQLPVAQPLGHVLVGYANQLAKSRQVPIVGLEQKRSVH